MTKVSVIIPVYNVEQHLRECLDSVINQTLKEIEIICINDGSTDSSLEILKEYADKDKRIIIIDQSNTGVGKARNNGLNIANGLFVSFIDPDDYYPSSDILETLFDNAITQNVLICGGSFCVDRNGVIESDFPPIHKDYVFEKEQLIHYKDYQFDYGYHRFIYNLRMLKDNDIYFPEYTRFQDPPFFVMAMIRAKVFYALPIFTYCYRAGHKEVNWNKIRTNDMIKGLLDNLKISREYGLAKLHAITIRRFNIDYINPIISNIDINNLEIISLLIEANNQIDTKLLKEMDPTILDNYALDLTDLDNCVLNPIKRLLLPENNKTKENSSELNRVKTDLNNVYNSYSFKIGRALTYVPRKIRNFFRMYGYKSEILK